MKTAAHLFCLALFCGSLFLQSPGLAATNNMVASQSCSALLDRTVQDIDGNTVNLCDYQGKVLLIVNVASKCDFTEQYDDLEALYQKYKDRGFVVLAFPSNDFKNQEPGTDDQIKQFAKSNYGVTFPMFSKIHVIGPQQAELYKKLTASSNSPVEWNFQKFLISRDGEFVKSFKPKTEPLSSEIENAIQKELERASVSSL